MSKALLISLSLVFIAGLFWVAWANDGTIEGAVPGSNEGAGTTVQVTDDVYVITPFESVSVGTSVWRDNRHRAYWNGSTIANGFLLFDVTAIPDTETIIAMTLKCYLENAFGSPAYNPVVDVYYSEDDGWNRATVGAGDLSLDVLLLNDVPFTSYIPEYDFVLDVTAHDWTQDLIDNQICIGFNNDVNYYSYVYFFGAYGSPTGPAPELTIETTTGGPMNITVVLTPYGAPIQIPASGGSFDYNVALTNNENSSVTFDAWIMAQLPDSSFYGPVLGPVTVTLSAGMTLDRDRTQSVPAAAPTGMYTYWAYVGNYPSDVWDSDYFPFEKLATGDGGEYVGDWSTSGDLFSEETPYKFALMGNYPNPFNPTTTVRFELPEAELVNLSVYNLNGSLVATLVDGYREAGAHEVTFGAAGLSSGVYFTRLTAGDYSSMHKMVLMK